MNHCYTFALWALVGISLAACSADNAGTPAGAATAEDGDEHSAAEDGDEHNAAEEPGHEDDIAVVALTPQQIAAVGIEIVEAASARIRETLPLYGVVTPNAVGVRQVSARYPGAIRSIAKNFGDNVRQGETLATIESNESLQAYTVTSPISGVLIARDANPGEQTSDRVLFTVADLSTVWVEVSLFPRDIGSVTVGQRVRVTGTAPGLSAEGSVIWVAPFGSSANQTLSARVLLDNADRRWAPGLYVTAHVTVAETDVPITVRNDALQTLEGRTVVFVQDADGFEPRVVELGRSDASTTEILSGIEPGERYVASNSFILKAELGKGEAEHGH